MTRIAENSHNRDLFGIGQLSAFYTGAWQLDLDLEVLSPSVKG